MFLADFWRYAMVLTGAGLCLAIEADIAIRNGDALLSALAGIVRVLT